MIARGLFNNPMYSYIFKVWKNIENIFIQVNQETDT